MNKLVLGFTIVVITLLVLWLLPAQPNTHRPASDTQQPTAHTPTLSFLRDNNSALSIQDIKQQYEHFTHTQEHILSFDRSTDNYWFSFDYFSPKNLKHAVLITQLPSNSHTTLWLETLSSNPSISPPIQPLLQPVAAFRLDLTKNQHYRFYIQAQHPRDLMRASFTLYERAEATTYAKKDTLIFSLFLGGFLVAALYNFLLAFNLNDWAYCNLSIFSLALAIEIILNENVIPWHPSLSTIDQVIHPILGFTILIACLNFAPKFVNHPKLTRYIEWIFKHSVVISLVFLPIALIHPQGDMICFWIALLILTPSIVTLTYTNLVNQPISYTTLLILFLFAIAWPAHLLAETGFIRPIPSFDYIRYAGSLLAATLVSLVHHSKTRYLEQEAERARALNRAKDDFLTTITHELRTPMHSVIGIGELLHKDNLDETQRKLHTHHLLEASQHMLGLVDDILDLAQLEQASPKLTISTFSLHHFLHSFRSIFETSAQQKGLVLNINIKGDSHINISADRKRLSQVIINLVGNAIKYTEQGHIELFAEIYKTTPQTCHLFIAIRDTGIGISKQDQCQLFNAFYQVRRGRNRPFRGTGLGLAISYRLVQLMGGQLNVESQPQQGSSFFFSLQLSTSPALSEASTSKTVSPDSLKNKHILLVDDDQLNAHIAKAMLEKSQAQVSLAFGGEEAIQTAKHKNFDLIFMDISMPKMDGYETTRRLHKLYFPNHPPPIIALTAHTLNQERERCLEAGMNDYLSKPFTIEAITQIGAHWLKQQ